MSGYESDQSDKELSDNSDSSAVLSPPAKSAGKQASNEKRPSRKKALPVKYKNGLSDPFLESGFDPNSKSTLIARMHFNN